MLGRVMNLQLVSQAPSFGWLEGFICSTNAQHSSGSECTRRLAAGGSGVLAITAVQPSAGATSNTRRRSGSRSNAPQSLPGSRKSRSHASARQACREQSRSRRRRGEGQAPPLGPRSRMLAGRQRNATPVSVVRKCAWDQVLQTLARRAARSSAGPRSTAATS